LNDTLGYAVGMNVTIIKTTSEIVSVKNSKQLSSIKIFPNPTSNYINITGINAELLKATILDLHGKIILEKNMESERVLSVESLPKGSYLLSLESELGQTLKKIIIH